MDGVFLRLYAGTIIRYPRESKPYLWWCPLGIQTIHLVVLIGLMFKPVVKFSAQWDSIAQALYKKFLAVVGIVSYTELHLLSLLKLGLFHYIENDINPMVSYVY